MFKDIAMDNKDDLDISKMMWDCMEYMHTEREYVEKLCKLIKEVGISQRREHIFNINTPTTVKTKEEVERENSMDTSDDTKSFVVN